MKTSHPKVIAMAILLLAIGPAATGCMASTVDPEEAIAEEENTGEAEDALCPQSVTCSLVASNPTCSSCESTWSCPEYVPKPYPPCNTMIDPTPECADVQPGPATVTTWQELWWCSSCAGSWLDTRTSTTLSCGC